MNNKKTIEQRVIQASEQILAHQHYVSTIDVFVGIGLLQPVHVESWRKGTIDYLEQVIQGNLSKISGAMACFHHWAIGKGLNPKETIYLARTQGPKRVLRFSKSGDLTIEVAYRTHYVSPLLTEQKQQRLQEKLEKEPELVVFCIITASQCSLCQKEMPKGDFLFMEKDKPLCLKCAGFEALIFLESGDPKLTRRAKKYSTKIAIVLKFSRARKRYERQGLLVEEEAFEKAQNECL